MLIPPVVSSGEVVPVEVSFTFATPLVRPSAPVHLDAVLLYANCYPRREQDERAARVLLNMAVPTARMDPNEPNTWVYCCSAIMFDFHTPFNAFKTRRLTIQTLAEDIADGLVKVDPSTIFNGDRGDAKGALIDIPKAWCRKATAWCLVQDMDAFSDLVSNIRQIGKGGAYGDGTVAGVEVEINADAERHWLRRVLPFPVEHAAPLIATTQPPYWDRSKMRDAWIHPSLLSGGF